MNDERGRKVLRRRKAETVPAAMMRFKGITRFWLRRAWGDWKVKAAAKGAKRNQTRRVLLLLVFTIMSVSKPR